MKNETIIIFCLLALGACSIHGPQTSETVPDKVLSRIDALEERPEWVSESTPFLIKNGIVSSLGQTEIGGDQRVEAAYRIAENNAKGSIASTIESRLEFVFQNAEEGTGFDSTQARFIGAEASKITSSSLRLSKRYWEKYSTSLDSGERATRYRIFVRVEMPENEFKKAIQQAVNRQGNKGLSSDFAKKVDDHWSSFTAGAPSGEGKAN